MSSLQRCPHYRGALTTEVPSLLRCPHYRGALTTEVSTGRVSSLQGCPHYRDVLTTEVPSLLRCPHYRGALSTEVPSLQRCPHYRGVLTGRVSSYCLYQLSPPPPHAGEKWDVVCVDVDNKNHHHGVACPPAEFIGRGFLGDVKKILTPHGECRVGYRGW